MRRQRSPIPTLLQQQEKDLFDYSSKPQNSAASSSSSSSSAMTIVQNYNKNCNFINTNNFASFSFSGSPQRTAAMLNSKSVSPLCTTLTSSTTATATKVFIQEDNDSSNINTNTNTAVESEDIKNTTKSSSAMQRLHPIPQLPSIFSNPHFLAEGGYGRVVQAIDLKSNNQQESVVAIKIMNLVCCKEDAQRMERLSEFGDLARILPGQDYVPFHVSTELRAHDALRDVKGTMPLLRVEIFCDYSSTIVEKNSYGQEEELVECFVMLVLPLLQPLRTKSFKNQNQSTSLQLLQSAKKLSHALLGMHSRGWLHRDLSVSNIFVSRDEDNEQKNVFIGDFGLTVCSRGRCNSASSKLLFGPATNACTTIWYRSPEILQNPDLPYTNSNDAWSLGTVVCELALSSPLFPGMTREDQLSEMEACLGQNGEKCEEFWNEILNSTTNACSECPKRREIVRAASRHLLCFDPTRRNIQKFADALEQIL